MENDNSIWDKYHYYHFSKTENVNYRSILSLKSSISFKLRLKLYFRCVHSLTCCDLRKIYHLFQIIEYSIGKRNYNCEYSFAQFLDIGATYLTTKIWEGCRNNLVWGLTRNNLTSNNLATQTCHNNLVIFEEEIIWQAIVLPLKHAITIW